ncbi:MULTISPECIES: hydrogenase maturation protein [unclassified Lysobacter]|uniref:hydrogenase maturation protein n=1 Tax=unclassified Lysobacter TaxID=2635362 RepID=UPI001BE5EAFC|nr:MULTISPECIES: hydrogenase maturation protein [unclassified Lysobacter]MBT2746153.1 hydrogenase maturation protein [Lysobacter sp. ISL-42]MBT2753151.1 hydrogenase maturation protein [Lysobacter sp. ISL-50]MBT2776865.1 hydrogenase maturation protein [Lysobacter sp. ISL-54]MBT2782388.1 hydrogenase maturation protein [Lysobacter sp. ISL-52]
MSLRILFLCTAYNGLAQRAWAELTDLGHQVSVQIASDPDTMRAAVARERPQLIVAPMLKTAIPEDVWRRHTCLIVHPGIVGDRGPSSLDWAILEGEHDWGVTVLQAAAEMDAGDIWASAGFAMRGASKSQLYRHEVTDAASRALLQAVERFETGGYAPQPLDYAAANVRGRLRASMRAADRSLDWEMDNASLLARIRSGDSFPGARGEIAGVRCHVFGAHEEPSLRGRPGELLGRREGAICIGTRDGALWLSHLREKDGIKLPATLVLGEKRLREVAQRPLRPATSVAGRRDHAYRQIRYREAGAVGYLHFDFYNGAMSTAQCDRLRTAFLQARQRPTRAIVLMGGSDIWSNGIHLNTIQAASDPALESWRNILAMNALVREIVLTDSHLVISAMRGNAGAGGVILALAADQVWARRGAVMNPHYKSMGGLYGSEYWTYLLPRRVGETLAQELTEGLRPIGAAGAERIGLIDAAFGASAADFVAHVEQRAERAADPVSVRKALAGKRRRRAADERRKPLESYGAEELAHMYRNFFGSDRSYHEARRRFVLKCAATACEALPEQSAPRRAEVSA